MVAEFHIRGGFGHNAHILQDVRKVLTGFDDLEGEVFICPSAGDLRVITYANDDGTEVWLGRRKIGDRERPYQDVWQISHVVAQTQERLEEFLAALEYLEYERATQIIESWKEAGWPTEYLETLTDRQIMVVDAMLDNGLGGKTILHNVGLRSAFENGSSQVVWEATQVHRDYMPVPECIEYIAAHIAPYEFLSLEAARLARFMWGSLNQNSEAAKCMVTGLVEEGHIRRLPNWTGWGDIYPFGFLSHPGALEDE